VKVSKQPFQGLSDEGFPAFHYLLKQTNAKMIQVESTQRGFCVKAFALKIANVI
jgi:S-adenosylmethionine/arginine decarboxylase-like enzyme